LAGRIKGLKKAEGGRMKAEFVRAVGLEGKGRFSETTAWVLNKVVEGRACESACVEESG